MSPQKLEQLKKEHKELKQRHDILQRDVLRFRESEKLKVVLRHLEAKKPWLIFERQRGVAKEIKVRQGHRDNAMEW